MNITCKLGLGGEKTNYPSNSKIDPNIYSKFNGLELQFSTALPKVRVIICLNNERNINFKTVSPENAATTVRNEVKRVQANFLNSLDKDGLLGQISKESDVKVETIMEMEYQCATVALISNRQTLLALADKSEVTYIELDKLNELYTTEGRNLTGSDVVDASGYSGNGVGVAVIDSHFDLLHPELGGSTFLPNGVVFDGMNFSDPGQSIHSQIFGNCYHGTGTASIVKRYAQDANLYCLTVFPNAYDSVIAQAINWCVTNKDGTNGGAQIKVISMSLGGERYFSQCNAGLMHAAAGTALANGILVLAASGNDGWTDSMGSPACSDNIISVGSVWDEDGAAYSPFPPAHCTDNNRQANERTCYSDTAPFLDIYAPSEEVICAACGGGIQALGGTSSACPAAAGMIAQFLDYDSSYSGNKSMLVSHLQSTGVQVIGDTSKRRIDLDNAISGGSGGNVLSNGQTVTGLAESTGNWIHYSMNLPSGATNLSFSMSGGSGDANLYTKFGSQPSLASYDCRPYINGNSESCSFSSPQTGTYYVSIRAFSTFSDVSLTASYTTQPMTAAFNANPSSIIPGQSSTLSWTTTNATSVSISGIGSVSPVSSGSTSVSPTSTTSYTLTATGPGGTITKSATVTVTAQSGNVLSNGQTVTGLAESTGNWIHYSMNLPSGAANLSFSISGESGDADLYTKFGSQPNFSSYDCRPYLAGNSESCSFSSPQTGTYYVSIRAFSTFSDVSLTASYTTQPMTAAFNANPSLITHGQSSTLSWTTTNATSVSISGIGSVSPVSSGSTSVSPTSTTSYTLTATGPGGTITKSATVTVTPQSGNVLSNGQTVTGLAESTGNWIHYSINVPSGATNLLFSISGGSGDADLYTKFGLQPNSYSYDCSPYIYGNSESCSFSSPQTGTYYVSINAYSTFSNVSLTASYTTPSEVDDVIIDFGNPYGIWVRMNNSSTWTWWHNLSPESIITADLDGNGQDDAIIDFGSGIGIYVRMNNSSTWTRWHNLSPESITTGDLDGNGQDDAIIDFGSGLGIYVRMNNSSTWTWWHNLSPEIITTGDLDGN